uniref:Uncharacterized protein n=1 Tax=Plectus sambesii TaxID=2011161 RepID=A0A914X396_9BILA
MEEKKALAESPSNQQSECEGTSLASSSSALSSSNKRPLLQDESKEGFSDVPSIERTKTEGTLLVELAGPSTLSSSFDQLHLASGHMLNNQGFLSAGSNSGIQVAPVHGGTQYNQQAQGDIHIHNYGVAHGQPQAPSTSSSTPSQPSTENWQQMLEK